MLISRSDPSAATASPRRRARAWGQPPVPLRMVRALFAVAALTACASLSGQEPSPPGPGVPRLLTARFDPETVRVGEETTLVLTFEDSEGDVVEAFLVSRVVDDFRFVSSTSVIQRNIRRHLGEVVGTVRETFRWENPSIRFYDVYVVDVKGNASNRIPIRVTVR